MFSFLVYGFIPLFLYFSVLLGFIDDISHKFHLFLPMYAEFLNGPFIMDMNQTVICVLLVQIVSCLFIIVTLKRIWPCSSTNLYVNVGYFRI